MRTIATEIGIIYDGGKIVDWEVFYDILYGVADQKTTDKIKKKIKDLINFTPILINQKTNNQEIAEILGVKIIDDDEKLKKKLLKKLEQFRIKQDTSPIQE